MGTIEADWAAAEREYGDAVIGQDTIPRLFAASASRHAARDAQWYKGGIADRSLTPEVLPPAPDGEYAKLSYGTLQEIVQLLAAGFVDLGVRSDMRVGLFADTRMEWAQVDLAVLAAGGVVTPIPVDTSADSVRFILEDADPTVVVVDDESRLPPLVDAIDTIDIEAIVVIDELERFEDRDDTISLAAVHERGASSFDRAAYESWLANRSLDDLASLVYTTAGIDQPRGVRLTHGNFRAAVNGLRRRFGPRPDKDPALPRLDQTQRSLSFLPLSSVLERTVGHFSMFAAGATVAYAESPSTVAEDMVLVEPTTATTVPRVYDRIATALRTHASASTITESTYEWAMATAREYARADDPGIGLRARHRLADYLVFRNVRAGLGGAIEFFISGGGSLPTALADQFTGMGMPILEGYGHTETAPVVAMNPPEDHRPGTLGPPLVGVDVRLDDSLDGVAHLAGGDAVIGELQVAGPTVTDGYWNLPDEMAAAFTDDGWFRTGDIIEQTPDGYLIFHDCIDRLLHLETGETVVARPVEAALTATDRIDQAMVVGDDRPFVAALIVPDFAAIDAWAAEAGIELPGDRQTICTAPRVHAWVADAVETVNDDLPAAVQIDDFRLVPDRWTVDNDLLTAAMALDRDAIRTRHADQIESLYAEAEAT